MIELGFVCSCIQKYIQYNVGIVPLRDSERTINRKSNIQYSEGALVLFDLQNPENEVRAINSILRSNIRIPWGDLFVSDSFFIPYKDRTSTTQTFDIWGDWLNSITPKRFHEITDVVYELFSNGATDLIPQLANTSFIRVFAKYGFTAEYRETLSTANQNCYNCLCNAVFSTPIILSRDEFRTVFHEMSRIPIQLESETFCYFLLRNNVAMKSHLPLSSVDYESFSKPLKIGFINYLSNNEWSSSVFINKDLTLTALSETLKSDKIYNHNIINSGYIVDGTIDEYIALLDNHIIKSIAYSCVRDAINKEKGKLSVLQKYVKRGFKESDAIIAIEPIGDSQLLCSFKEWAFNKRILNKIPEDSWDSIQFYNSMGARKESDSSEMQLPSNDAVSPILRRLLFWEQVRVLSQPDSIIESLDLDSKLKTTIQSLGGVKPNNQEWRFYYEDELEKLFLDIIDTSRKAHCLHDVIGCYPMYGQQLKHAIKRYCEMHPVFVLEDSTISAFLREPELYEDKDITHLFFDYLSSDAEAFLQLVKHYPSFNEHWKGDYLRVVCGQNSSPAILIKSGFIEIVGNDNYFRSYYPAGLDPRKDIGKGSLEEYVILYRSGIITDRQFILSLACKENNIEILKSLHWTYTSMREMLLSSRENLPLLSDFEIIIQSTSLREQDVTQFNNLCLYDEWLILLVKIGHTEAFLVDLIKKRLHDNQYSIDFIDKLSASPKNSERIDPLRRHFDDSFIADAIKDASDKGIVPVTTLAKYCHLNDKLFKSMCEHPDFNRALKLDELSDIYTSFSEPNKEFMIHCLYNHDGYKSLLFKLDVNKSVDEDFRKALLHEAIKGLISSIRENGIDCFYHFTDGRNYDSIRKIGLISYRKAKELRIPCITGGDNNSIDIDKYKGSDAYVHLSLCRDTAMGFKRFINKEPDETQLCFRISLDVLYLLMDAPDNIMFTSINAASGKAQLKNISCFRIDFAACKTSLKEAKRMKEDQNDPHIYTNRQAEILVRAVPPEYIENLESPLRDNSIYN